MLLTASKFLLTSAALTLCVISSAVRGQERSVTPPTAAVPEWKTYRVSGEEFSVSLPALPAMTTQTVLVSKLDKHRKQRTIGAYADGVVFAIFTFENPHRRQSIEDLIYEGYGNPRDKIQRNLTVGDFSGREYVFGDADRKGVAQFFITDRHIYLFEVVGSRIGNPDVLIPKFLSSIRFAKNPAGIEVDNGPGEQAEADPAASNHGDDARPLNAKEVTRKAGVVTRPEPAYTYEARTNRYSGTVVLQCVFSSAGVVTDIRASYPQPFGLTERAIAAARQIRFIPAIKDGHFVSMHIQLEYNFNMSMFPGISLQDLH